MVDHFRGVVRRLIAVGLAVGLCCGALIAEETVIQCQDYGATANDQTDDTAAIQKAVEAAASVEGRLLIPAGEYFIDATVGVILRSRMRLELASGAVLRAIPHGSKSSRVILIKDVESIQIHGGTIEGDRQEHLSQDGEWGMGIEIRHAKDIAIDRITIRDCWGDGIYISQRCERIRVSHLLADRNRRQGLTVTSADDVEIRESVFRNTSGTAPESGVDIEPNKGETVSNCRVHHCLFLGNAGGGIQAGVPLKHRGESFVTSFLAEGNTLLRNGPSRPPVYAIQISGCDGALVKNNQLSGNLGSGIGVIDSTKTRIEENSIHKTNKSGYKADAGLFVKNSTETTIQNNKIQANQGFGVYLWSSEADTTKNTIDHNQSGDVFRR